MIMVNFEEANGGDIETQDEIEVFQRFGLHFPQQIINDEIYLSPVDEREANRLDDLHEILTQVLADVTPDGLVIAPVDPNRAKVLDCGFGTAAWTVAVARAYPNWKARLSNKSIILFDINEQQVVGVDIWGRMATEAVNELSNINLQIADLNDRFTFPGDSFDLVHSRLVAGGIASNRWSSYIKDIYRVLKPGGWVQMFEFYYNIQSSSGLLEGSSCRQWSEELQKCMAQSSNPLGRKDLRICVNDRGTMLTRLFKEAGFQAVESAWREIAISPWEQDEQKMEIGRRMNQQMRGTANAIGLLRSFASYPMTERMGMQQVEFEALIDRAGQELADLRNKPYLRLYLYRAQKPLSDPRIEILRGAKLS